MKNQLDFFWSQVKKKRGSLSERWRLGRPESERASFSCKKTNQQSTRQAREYLGQELGTELRVGQAATPEA